MKYFCQALNKFKLCQWHVLLESCQFKPLPGTQMPAFLQTSPLNLRADAPSLTPKSQHTPALLDAQSPFVEQEIFLAVPGVTWVFSTIHRETPARWWWWTNKIKHRADKKKAFPSLWKQQSLPAAGGDNLFIRGASGHWLVSISRSLHSSEVMISCAQGDVTGTAELLRQLVAAKRSDLLSLFLAPDPSLAWSSGTLPLRGWKDLIH